MSAVAANPLLDNPLEVEPILWPRELREHLSPSSIGLFARCPEQFRRRYVLGDKERPGASLVWGNADHKAHEVNFAQKINSHEDIAQDDVKLAFAEFFDQEVESNGGTTEVNWGDDKPSALKDSGVRLVAAYHHNVSPSVQPIAVERWIEVELPGIPVPFKGRIDIETESTVIDGKTSAAKKSRPEPHWRPQAFVYQLATHKPFEFHVKTKTKTPAVYTGTTDAGLRMPFNPALLSATTVRVQGLVRTMLSYLAEYGPHTPWPSSAPDYGWACGYCGFRPSCAHWAGT